jgi:CspA family cold shock protein
MPSVTGRRGDAISWIPDATDDHDGPRRMRAVGLLYDEIGDSPMATGTVKFFNTSKGYGFLQPEDGGKDVFVHITAVQRAGLDTLSEGQRVSYELVTERGKTAAGNLKAL